jgi:hypothetical protein
MSEAFGTYGGENRVVVGKSEGKRPFGILRCERTVLKKI